MSLYGLLWLGVLDTGGAGNGPGREAVETAASIDPSAVAAPLIIALSVSMMIGWALFMVYHYRLGSLRDRCHALSALLGLLLRSLEIRNNIDPTLKQLERLHPERGPSLKAKDQLRQLLQQLVFGWKEIGFNSQSDGATAFVAVANHLAATQALGKHSCLAISTNAKLNADQVARMRSSDATQMWFVTSSAQLNDIPRDEFSLAFRIVRKSADGSPVIVIYPRRWSSTAADMDDRIAAADHAETPAGKS